jgi:predicted ATPase
VIERLTMRAAGNPLFIEEVLCAIWHKAAR